MRRFYALIFAAFFANAQAATAETLYDATLYAGGKLCEAMLAKKCKMPDGVPAPAFKDVAECKKQGKVGADAGAEATKTVKIKNYAKCKAAIDTAAAKGGDCMSIGAAHMSAGECK